MRVVSGRLRGRKIKAVPSTGTRPVLERVRTALFDTLAPDLPGASVLDAFAGTGSLGIEALSRGAASCTFLDIGQAALETLRFNVKNLEIQNESEVRKSDAFAFVRHTKRSFDLVLIAPPQYEGLWSEMLHLIAERPDVVSPGGLLVTQIDPKEYLPGHIPQMTQFTLEKNKRYGNTLILIFRRSSD
jgi:16S rRNA (guanine966-N2)-methyltransferase